MLVFEYLNWIELVNEEFVLFSTKFFFLLLFVQFHSKFYSTIFVDELIHFQVVSLNQIKSSIRKENFQEEKKPDDVDNSIRLSLRKAK